MHFFILFLLGLSHSDRYHRLFLYHYSLCLRAASFVFVNSSWTKNEIDGVLRHSDKLLDLLYLTPPFLAARLLFLSDNTPAEARIVYPPFDTRKIEKFKLGRKEPIILSIAQFRFVNLLIRYVQAILIFI